MATTTKVIFLTDCGMEKGQLDIMMEVSSKGSLGMIKSVGLGDSSTMTGSSTSATIRMIYAMVMGN